mgnify:CR=1 FL=1
MTTFKPGDRVLISCITSCGKCEFCRKGMYSHCTTGGWQLGHLIDGTQAEYVRVPHADTSLYPIPADADEEADDAEDQIGIDRAMKGGIGTASVTVGGVTVGALIACNALGDVVDPDTAAVVAGARTLNGRRLLDTRQALLRGDATRPLLAGTNTTIGVVATDAILTKVQAHRLAIAAHDGLARSINPVHTMSDSDTLFSLGTGRAGKSLGMMVLATMAAEATARATVRAVQAARSVTTAEGLYLPAMADLRG